MSNHRPTRRSSRFVIILIAGCFVSLSSAHGQTPKEDYALQERCGKRAEEIFKGDWGGGISSTADTFTIARYTNHYNKKLNRCFYLLSSTTITTKGDNKSKVIQEALYDINENKEYGSLTKEDADRLPFSCNMQGIDCRSKQEWDYLIKPFMTE